MTDLSVTIVNGRVTGDSVTRATKSGMRIVSFSVAVNESRLDKSTNQWTDTPTFFNVSWFLGSGHKDVTLSKGESVTVMGRMVSEKFQDKSGQQRTAWTLRASQVSSHTKAKGQAGQTQQRPQTDTGEQSIASQFGGKVESVEEFDDSPIPF